MCLTGDVTAKFLAILSSHLPRQGDFSPENAAVSSRALENDPYDSTNISGVVV